MAIVIYDRHIFIVQATGHLKLSVVMLNVVAPCHNNVNLHNGSHLYDNLHKENQYYYIQYNDIQLQNVSIKGIVQRPYF